MYKNLAEVYDILMEDIPYDKWAKFIDEIIKQKNKKAKDLLDLGCGTGNISIFLTAFGYNLTGIDLSKEMLSKAKTKYEQSDLQAVLEECDIREIDYEDQFDAIICTFDTLNYFTETQEFKDVLKRCFKALKKDGVLIFDLNSKNKFEKILGQEIYTYNTSDLVYIWENDYDESSGIMEIDISFFIKKDDGRYERFNEYHVQKYYSIEKVMGILEEIGFEEREVYHDLFFEYPTKDSIKNFFIAQKK